MDQLLKRIAQLEKISAELEPTQQERQGYNTEINEYANDFINSLSDRPAYYKGDVSLNSLSLKKRNNHYVAYYKFILKRSLKKALSHHLVVI